MKDKITVNGVEYTILTKFTSKTTEKDYIIYSTLEPVNNEIEIYSAIYNNGELSKVDTPEEEEIIDKMISTITTIPEDINYIKK